MSLAGGTLRGKGREVRQTLSSVFETSDESLEDIPEEEKPDDEKPRVKQLGKLLEQQLAGAERQDGFSYFAGDRPKLEKDNIPSTSTNLADSEKPGPSYLNRDRPALYTVSVPAAPDSYEDLLTALAPSEGKTRRRRRRSRTPDNPYTAHPRTPDTDNPYIAHPNQGDVGYDARESLEVAPTTDTAVTCLMVGTQDADTDGFFEEEEEEDYSEKFRISTVSSTVSSVSDDEYVLFKVHDDDEVEEW